MANLAENVGVGREQLLGALVVFVALHAAVFTPDFPHSAACLGIDNQLQLFGLIRLVNDGLYDCTALFEVLVAVGRHQHMQRLVVALVGVVNARLAALASYRDFTLRLLLEFLLS